MGVESIGENIRRIMKSQGLSIKNLAEMTGMGTASLSNILNGKSEPRSSNLLKLSHVLRVQLKDLLEESPKIDHVRFRAAKLSAREKAEKEQTVINTARWLYDYKYLEDELDDHQLCKLKSLSFSTPVDAAQKVREVLKLGLNEPISDIKDLIEQSGIKIRMYEFGFKRVNGLSVADEDIGPAIIVNSDRTLSVERQIFTIAHELGHLLLHKDSYNNDSEENKEQEKEADIFAGNLLLPEEALKKAWEENRGLDWIDSVLKIKKIFKVSYMTVLVRLVQVYNSTPPGEVFKKFNTQYKMKTGHDLKNHYEPDALPVAEKDPDALSRTELLGGRYLRLVRKAYEEGIISISRAAEMMNLSLKDMRQLVLSWRDNP